MIFFSSTCLLIITSFAYQPALNLATLASSLPLNNVKFCGATVFLESCQTFDKPTRPCSDYTPMSISNCTCSFDALHYYLFFFGTMHAFHSVMQIEKQELLVLLLSRGTGVVLRRTTCCSLVASCCKNLYSRKQEAIKKRAKYRDPLLEVMTSISLPNRLVILLSPKKLVVDYKLQAISSCYRHREGKGLLLAPLQIIWTRS